MDRRWYTKEEIQADLTLATGLSTPLLGERFVYGDRPPPPPRLAAYEESEKEHQLRSGGAYEHTAWEGPPDLHGITHMLRMIQNYESTRNSMPISPNDNEIVISKPNFHGPKCLTDESRTSTPKSISSSKLNPDVDEFVPRCAIAGQARKHNMEREETHAVAQRSEIGSAAPRDRRRSAPPAPAPAPAPAPRPVLLTPDYFRTPPAAPAAPAPDESELRASICKVSAWLHAPPTPPAPEPPASPMPLLSPPTYKRRRAAPPAPGPPAPPPAPPRDLSYVPSAHARVLAQQYAARDMAPTQARPSSPPLLWHSVELQLRGRTQRPPSPALGTQTKDTL